MGGMWNSEEPSPMSFGGVLFRTAAIFVLSGFASVAISEALTKPMNGYFEFTKNKKTQVYVFKAVFRLIMGACMSFFGIYLVFSPCFSCARHHGYTFEGGVELILGGAHTNDIGNNGISGLWQIIFENRSPDEVEPGTQVCRACLSWLLNIPYVSSAFDDTLLDYDHNESIVTLESGKDLIGWYNEFYKIEREKHLAISWNTIKESVLDNGQFNSSNLRDALDHLLCSVTSRVDNPNPALFLSDLERPKYTGEDVGGDEALDISLEKLQDIMRSSMLRKLGPSVCFMLRIPLLIPKDLSTEENPVSSILDAASLMSQVDMKVEDVAFDVPGLQLSQVDPDFDPHSKRIKSVKSAMGIYTQLPFEDDPYYFDTHHEYMAFFRWTLANALQSEWYLPKWLHHLDDNNDFASFLAEQQMYSPDMTSFVDPTSDRTLADRTFFGTGQKFLTHLKLPGDTDYHYMHPGSPGGYISRKHQNFYRNTNKPTKEELLGMAQSFWSKEIDTDSACDTNTSSSDMGDQCLLSLKATDTLIQRMRSDIVEVDFAYYGSMPARENQFYPSGAILYLDSASRMPMGIFKTNKTDDGEDMGTMYLPTNGRDWEHAKFSFRTVERATLAFIHVIESHLGWSHAISVASMQTLPSTHKLYALLKPFTMNVHVVNSAAYHLLVREHSVLEHASGLLSVPDALNFFGHSIDFEQTFPDYLAAKKLNANLTNDIPLFSQGQRLWEVHYEFVSDFVTNILYDSDRAMIDDDSIHRFWHHVNTFGRGHDPCVCDMGTDHFYKEGMWPHFDSNSNTSPRTCDALMDSAEFQLDLAVPNNRRHEWCLKDGIARIDALRKMLDDESKKTGNPLRHSFEHMKLNMGLKPLKSRQQLVDFLTSAIWHVTVGHRINSDNLAYLTDPEMVGVRHRKKDANGELPVIADVGTYVYGLTIGALTTVKDNALLADWMPIYSYMSDLQDDLSKEEKSNLLDSVRMIHRRYKSKLLKLSRDFLRESASRPRNQRTNVFNPASQSASVSV